MNGDDQVGPVFNTRLLVRGAVLLGVGGLLAGAGLLVGGMAVMSAGREWVSRLDKPSTEAAANAVKRLSAATSAGADGWLKHPASAS